MFKKVLIGGLGVIASWSAFANSLSGNVTFEDARTNPSVAVERIVEIRRTPDIYTQCGGMVKTFGGNELYAPHRISEIKNYQDVCHNGATQFVQVKWHVVNQDRWFIENFVLPPQGVTPSCDIHIKLEDNVNANWPSTIRMIYTQGCGRPPATW
jgi:hypothetical protein